MGERHSKWVATDRVFPRSETNPMDGVICIVWPKALWLAAHITGGIAAIFLFPSLLGLLIFVALTALSICLGHSVGMHRLLIHRSFSTSKWLEYTLVWLGTLVGMAGPFGMIRAHDMRDWHQRQTLCPPHPSHGAGFWRDAWWQLCCEFRLINPPHFQIEEEVANDPVYAFMERTWMAQQLILTVPLFLLGGIGFVLWGICLRISVSLIGHWAVGHYAHRRGSQIWRIKGLPSQGYNLSGLGLITFGEAWHGNHHAFPHSARLGIEPGQMDPGFGVIRVFEKLKLAWNVQLPDTQPAREGLYRVAPLASNDHREA
ncbi:acyl-CoA desaturase [Pseudahrensia aquimaris]|uniref:Acyl-CoA desaturase n=1 Tax=Pseudahrensia aquimaris TaxID=744461 RepID=A0ABW3FF87_9HYPH